MQQRPFGIELKASARRVDSNVCALIKIILINSRKSVRLIFIGLNSLQEFQV